MKGAGMYRQLRKLLEILSRESGCYSMLLELLQEEHDCIGRNDVDKLNEIVNRQNTVILELKALEEARSSLVKKIARDLGISAEGLSLTALAEHVDEPFSETLISYGNRIDELSRKIQQINANNSYLIDKSISFIVSALRIFATADAIPKQGSLICDVA